MPGCIFLGYSSAQHSLGTVTTDWILTPADTDIQVLGPITVTPPVVPSDNQSITIINVGPDAVTVADVTTVPPFSSVTIYWGGASWGWANDDCTLGELPAASDRGTTQFAGPSETPYSVPQTTVNIGSIATLPCGLSVIKTVTKTYSLRSVANVWSILPGVANAISYTNYTPANTNVAYSLHTGATSNAVIDAVGAEIFGIIPSTFVFDVSNVAIKESVSPNYATFSSVCVFGNYNNGVRVGGSWSHQIVQTPAMRTMYYLDVHEVWTYYTI